MPVSTLQEKPTDIVVADSISHAVQAGRGRVIVTGSHAGSSAAAIAAAFGVRAVIFNDAGVGLRRAGIDGLSVLGQCGIAAAAVGHMSARIGDGKDTHDHGVITHANEAARGLGVSAGQGCEVSAALLIHARVVDNAALPPMPQTRRNIYDGAMPIWLIDSASEILASDAGSIVITGSHGGLPGGRIENASKAALFAAVFNDAGVGCDRAGLARLSALEARGIAGMTVSHDTAMIGSAESTYTEGRISCANNIALDLGVKIGTLTREVVDQLVAHKVKRSS